MKRRDFIRNAGVAMSAPLLLNGLSVRSLASSPFLNSVYSLANNRVIVIIQMQGGNDGLNMILPIDKYAHLSQTGSNGGRAEILVPDIAGLKFLRGGIDQYTNTRFHPAMSGLASLYSMDKLCVVQGVGYQNQSFSHFRSTDIWMSGSDPSVVDDSGWIGRKLDADYPNYLTNLPIHPLALNIGSVSPNLFMGNGHNLGIAVQNPTSGGNLSSNNIDTAPNNIYGYELDYTREVLLQTNSFFSVVQGCYSNGTNIAAYPATSLAQQLKTVARLLNGGLETRFFMVNVGSFDTHDTQVDPADTKNGWHATLLKTLSEAITAFQSDIAQLSDNYGVIEDRVLGMTFSEFGRTIKANTTYGTDHGTSAPLMIFGQDVNPIILGANPEVYDSSTSKIKSDLEVQFDFRSIYASVLHQWMELPVSEVNSLLYQNFQDGTNPVQNIYDGGLHCNLPILKPTGAYSPTNGITSYQTIASGPNLYPNPTSGELSVKVNSIGEELEFSIYDLSGKEVMKCDRRFYPKGEQEIQLDLSGLTSGSYQYLMRSSASNYRGSVLVK